MVGTYGRYEFSDLSLEDRKELLLQVQERINSNTLIELVNMCGGCRLPNVLIRGGFLKPVYFDIFSENEITIFYNPNEERILEYLQ